MIHYHGTPISPRAELLKLAGRHFCVPFADARDVRICHQIGQSVMLDNGAYSVWKRGAQIDWNEWRLWAEEWVEYPTTWAVLPDVVDGDENDNRRLLDRYGTLRGGVPVWHLHESFSRLGLLVDRYAKVCFGSSGSYRVVGSEQWHRRISEAFSYLVSEFGSVPWVHMLRGMNLAGDIYPFASVDSTNTARNHSGSHSQRARSITQMVAELDARQCPGRWIHVGDQGRLGDEVVAF